MADPIFSIMVDDPHIVSFRGDEFDFMGQHGKWYNFLSAGTIQLNVKMTTFENDRTYISEVGLKIGQESKIIHLVHAKLNDELIDFDLDVARLESESNGLYDESGHPFQTIVLFKPKKKLTIDSGNFVIEISRGIEMYNEISCPHINIHVGIGELGSLSDGIVPHGVVGQFATRLKGIPRKVPGKQGEGIIDGNYKDYEVSGMFADDFVFNRFNSDPIREKIFGFGVSRQAISHF